MSVLRDRVVTHGGMGRTAGQYHPYGTESTPLDMPASEYTYNDASEQALYGTVHPLYTADGAVVPAVPPAYARQARPAPVIPAGRP